MEGSAATLSLVSYCQPRPGNVPVTCIGMSTGGIESLKTIFRELPAKSGMAFVVVHHIRNVPTLLPEILSACTPIARAIGVWRTRGSPESRLRSSVRKGSHACGLLLFGVLSVKTEGILERSHGAA